MRKLTTIDLPHRTLHVVGKLLESAGFTLGTVGGGYGEMEREGSITDEEKRELTVKMAELAFVFVEQDIE